MSLPDDGINGPEQLIKPYHSAGQMDIASDTPVVTHYSGTH